MYSALNTAYSILTAPQTQPSTSIDLAIWKWVVIVGVVAVIIFYIVKRVADIVVDKKTDAIIKDIVDEDEIDDYDG